MNKLCLANIDYASSDGRRGHMTDEGQQLQGGLAAAGWILAGHGFGDGCRDVPELLARHKPSVVFVQDVRDWDPASPGCFDKQVGFSGIEALAGFHGHVATVCKDAGSVSDYQREFAERIGAESIVVYYHERSVIPRSPWLSQFSLIRHYHTIDAKLCERISLTGPRKRGLVSGALNPIVYPLRCRVTASAATLGIDWMRHPGYGNRGCHTPAYLEQLATYKVHVATASSYGFALRKIIESVAMGCTPITDLPEYDRLPVIDEAIVRIRPDATIDQVRQTIDEAEARWNIDRAVHLAAMARGYYDYITAGDRLSQAIGCVAAAAA